MQSEADDRLPVTPPGKFIRDELKRRGWTQEDLANVLGRTLARVNELLNGKQVLSPEIALALSAVFGESPKVWLQREAAYRLSLATAETSEVRRRSRLFELGPVKEMQRRGWIRPTDSVDEIERSLLLFFGIPDLGATPSVHGVMRKTAPAIAATPAQRAWALRVRHVAAAIPPASIAKYDESRIADCQHELRKLASYSAGPGKVPEVLMAFGVRFVVVEGLSGAKVDGFATWLDDDSPVIGMSLRFDRLDSFWFTVGHEWSHIKHRDLAPIDSDATGLEDPFEPKSHIEGRADQESAALFIPPDELESFIRRVGPLYSTEKINQFANRIRIHPNIIVGQLKHRGEVGFSAHNKSIVAIRETVIKAAVTDGWGKSISLGAIS